MLKYDGNEIDDDMLGIGLLDSNSSNRNCHVFFNYAKRYFLNNSIF